MGCGKSKAETPAEPSGAQAASAEDVNPVVHGQSFSEDYRLAEVLGKGAFSTVHMG
eukprot:CAMPEP_0198433030 /NCGR_PEP_ID=MMETSP1452-20131203/25032_1 /TAXON_ID=1181717 /ORGANISM="Synchroma pusillum, Strain CCMP3072" /LENGTH=55 /DNA_ID=CAMNT_0044153521 /DNA_START=17 /DNA_END=180 /DNA_ORIENTATION=-